MKNGAEPKKDRVGWGRGRKETFALLLQRTSNLIEFLSVIFSSEC